jgi:hypothetical protein
MAYDPATPPLIEQWANNIDVFKPVDGSWIEGIAQKYGATPKYGDRLLDIYSKLSGDDHSKYGDHYQDIAAKLGDDTPLNGSYLERIVQLTTPA